MFAGEEGGQAVIEWDVLGVGFSPVRGLGVSASIGAAFVATSGYATLSGAKKSLRVDYELTNWLALSLQTSTHDLKVDTKDVINEGQEVTATATTLSLSYAY